MCVADEEAIVGKLLDYAWAFVLIGSIGMPIVDITLKLLLRRIGGKREAEKGAESTQADSQIWPVDRCSDDNVSI